MTVIPPRMAEAVAARAENRCEYCGLSQLGQEAAFHVTPRAAGGRTELDNLALACVSCSLRKGARQSATDPETELPAPLFDPRAEGWWDHFRWHEVWVIPLTAVGRATAGALDLNRPLILAIRHEETHRGRHPPPAEGV